jgi:hypothetical protein
LDEYGRMLVRLFPGVTRYSVKSGKSATKHDEAGVSGPRRGALIV